MLCFKGIKRKVAKRDDGTRVEKLKENIWRQEHEIQELKDANEELLTRLSAMAGARLTDGNANIADLSDENTLTKLAEQFSDLYDNEWTYAFEELTWYTDLSEQDVCHALLKAVCTSYIKSKEKADNDRQNMTEAMKTFLGDKEPPSELIKQLKDMRKQNFDGHIKLLKKKLQRESVKVLFPEKKMRNKKGLKQFLSKGLKLCWLMVIQDPPVFMDTHIEERGGEKHNNTLKPYTQSDQYIDYLVLPPLYLKEGGDVSWKGIAQFKSNSGHTQSLETKSMINGSDAVYD